MGSTPPSARRIQWRQTPTLQDGFSVGRGNAPPSDITFTSMYRIGLPTQGCWSTNQPKSRHCLAVHTALHQGFQTQDGMVLFGQPVVQFFAVGGNGLVSNHVGKVLDAVELHGSLVKSFTHIILQLAPIRTSAS